jgi:hypothetical protein
MFFTLSSTLSLIIIRLCREVKSDEIVEFSPRHNPDGSLRLREWYPIVSGDSVFGGHSAGLQEFPEHSLRIPIGVIHQD